MKLLIFDTETTGTNPYDHSIIQFAGIIIVDGEIIDRKTLYMSPGMQKVDPKALEVNGRTVDEIFLWPSIYEFHSSLTNWFGEYIDKYDSSDKLTPCAYNGWFDYQFLAETFKRAHDKWFGSWLNHRLIDPLPVLRFLVAAGLIDSPANFKLSTIAEMLGIDTKGAHDAMADVLMLKQIVDKLFTMVAINSQLTKGTPE